ncbi:MAG: hypothetical protein ACI8RD_000420 [Bacillariaceae sp.]|jgi:hypothetical protein
MYSFNTKKFAVLMANKRSKYLLRDTIAIGGIVASALLITQEEEPKKKQEESKMIDENILHSQKIIEQGSSSMTSSSTSVVSKKTADYLFVPQYDLLRGMFSSQLFSNVTACDSAFKQPNTHIHMENAATKKKLRSKYHVQWKRILGEGGFGAVYLGKEKKSGAFRFVFRFK